MARLLRPTLTWLLALVLPFQALTAAYLDIRGPLHFHVEHDHGDHAQSHAHGHAHAERHHHHPHDASVVSIHDDGGLETPALATEPNTGWSSIMFATLPASGSPQLLDMAESLTPQREPRFHTHVPERLERPPRTHLV